MDKEGIRMGDTKTWDKIVPIEMPESIYLDKDGIKMYIERFTNGLARYKTKPLKKITVFKRISLKRAINSARKILMGYVLRTYKGVMVIDHFISFDKKERKWELGIFLSSPHGWK